MPTRVVTANRLQDGAVVWRGADGRWLEEIDRAAASDNDAVVAEMLSGARHDETAGVVVAPYEVEVDAMDRLLPVGLRERIRAAGPTIDIA